MSGDAPSNSQGHEAQCKCPQHGSWLSAENIDALVRELDRALNGDGAAPQAALSDVVAQVCALSSLYGGRALLPLLQGFWEVREGGKHV
jgi:hypothetical protein